MGADFPEDEVAIALARALPQEVKGYLAHHLNNSLTGIIGSLEIGNIELAKKACWHLVADLRKLGINNFRRRDRNENTETAEAGPASKP